MKYITAGESHGKAIMGILEGLPSNLTIDIDMINRELARRQKGYGRGGRMLIETDTVEIIAGVRAGKTTGAPIGFVVNNKDYENWSGIIGPCATETDKKVVSAVRPGHADLVGCIKYDHDDARNILERASARETAAKVVIGAICKQFLSEIGVTIGSYTKEIGGVKAEERDYKIDEILELADKSPVRTLDKNAEKLMIERIDFASDNGDTVGGKVAIKAVGMPIGVGSHIAPDRRLEFTLMSHLGAIGSVKSVAIGDIDQISGVLGSEFHDALSYNNDKKIVRKTNHAGGIEGGISNGEDINITLTLKPIPSVPSGVDSINMATKQNSKSAIERGDCCVVAPAGVVAESVLAYALAEQVSEWIGGDTVAEVKYRTEFKRNASKG